MTAARIVLVLGLALLAGGTRAQTACPETLEPVERLYRTGRFADVEARLAPCVRSGAAPAGAFRLLALALVRQQRTEEAEQTVSALLDRYPGYVPDDVQDPPVYRALVADVQQRREPAAAPLEVAPIAVVAPEPAQPETPEARPLPVTPPVLRDPSPTGRPTIELSFGAESYDGERRRVGGGLVGGFVRNAGPSPALGLGLGLTRSVALDVRAQAVRLPRLIRDGLADDESGYDIPPGGTLGEPVTSYEILDPATSWRWVPSLAVGVRADAWPAARVTPYGRASVRVLTRWVNRKARVGIGPDVALGVAGGSRRLALFGEVGGVIIAPDSALDAAVFRTNGDLLLGLRFGVRLR